MVILVPGYGGRIRGVERWRMTVAQRTLARHGGGILVACGHRGEAERLASLVSNETVIIEPTARSTWENVERSIPHLEGADQIAVASDWFHARRAAIYLRRMRPDLAARLVPADGDWVHSWWVHAGGAAYAVLSAGRRLVRAIRSG
jgi:uncharacterized SAM-binding protein YcdF (DUF218 family)